MAFALAALAACLSVRWALAADKPSVLQLGSSGSLTKELPRSKVETANDALKKLIREETGFKSELVVTGSLEKLEEDVKNAEIDLKAQLGLLEAKKKEVNSINAKYDEDKRRYLELTGGGAAKK